MSAKDHNVLLGIEEEVLPITIRKRRELACFAYFTKFSQAEKSSQRSQIKPGMHQSVVELARRFAKSIAARACMERAARTDWPNSPVAVELKIAFLGSSIRFRIGGTTHHEGDRLQHIIEDRQFARPAKP